jgi:metal-responsive CopG/Arc/MetJ family transcriptional regulator
MKGEGSCTGFRCASPVSAEDYVTVKLPKALAEKFEKFGPKEGYRTFSEFVIHITRAEVERRR